MYNSYDVYILRKVQHNKMQEQDESDHDMNCELQGHRTCPRVSN